MGGRSMTSTGSVSRASLNAVDKVWDGSVQEQHRAEHKRLMKTVWEDMKRSYEVTKALRKIIDKRRQSDAKKQPKLILDRRQSRFSHLRGDELCDALCAAEPNLSRPWLLSLENSIDECRKLMVYSIDVTLESRHSFHGKPVKDFVRWFCGEYRKRGCKLVKLDQSRDKVDWSLNVGIYRLIQHPRKKVFIAYVNTNTNYVASLPFPILCKDLFVRFELASNHDRHAANISDIKHGDLPLVRDA